MHDGEEFPLFRVGVVVFTNVRGIDYSSASHAATRAVSRAVNGQEGGLVFDQEFVDYHWRVPVQVADVVELSMAAGNGYVAVVPATKAYRQWGNVAGGLPEALVRGWEPDDDE